MIVKLRDITVRQLRALAAVAAEGSVTAAAQKLHLSQPAVTQQLRNLQDLAGLPLLQRSSDGMLLTEAGKELLQLRQRIEASIEASELSLAMISGQTGGRITIGAVSTAKYFVPSAIAAFSKLHPKIDIKLSIGNRETLRRAMRGYDIDIAIMGRPPPDVDLEVRLLGDHPHVIIASRDHRLTRDRRLALVDLSHETFITREIGSGTRMLMESMFEAADLQPTVAMEMDSNETIKQAVMANLGIAFISAHTVASEIADGRLIILDVGGLPIVRQWYVMRRKDKVVLPPAQAIMDFMSSEAAKFLPNLGPATDCTNSNATS